MRVLQCFGRLFAAGMFFGGVLASAQTHQSLSPDQLLSQIEVNTDKYRATVPSFTCNEHIVSQELHLGQLKRETNVDAVFTVTRSAANNDTFEESRELKTINGKPATKNKMTLPLSFSGGFSGALTKFLSRDHQSCFEYAVDTSAPSPQGTEAFTFIARTAAAREPSCASIQPDTTGKFTVDMASMQVTHIERTVPNPVGRDQTVLGTAAVDYQAVTLNGKSFWLPATITAFTTETSKTDSVRFTAHYSDYHRFAATSTILPADR
jgi:hypothetical protein